MRIRYLLPILLALPFAAAACGGGGDDDGADDDTGDVTLEPDAAIPTPDAPPPPTVCAELTTPQGTISAVPGSFSGTVVGKGADINVPMGVCAVEADDAYWEPVGEDAVVHVTGLTAGTEYALILTAPDDLGFYVVTGCTGGTPGSGECLVFDDALLGGQGEAYAFTATSTEIWVVVDNAELPAPESGDFTLSVVLPSCHADTECTSDPARPYCIGYGCVECGTNFDCDDATAPLCTPTNTCVAGPTECTDDDAGDTGNGDDGPTVARTLATPTAGVPTVQAAAICGTPTTEADWYKVTLAAGDYDMQLAWTGATNDLDVYLLDATAQVVAAANTGTDNPEAATATIDTAGDYYVVVVQYAPQAPAAAAYTLTLSVPEAPPSNASSRAGLRRAARLKGRSVAGHR